MKGIALGKYFLNIFPFSIRKRLPRNYLSTIRACIFYSLLIFSLFSKNEVWASDEIEVITYPGVSEKEITENSLRSIFSMHLKTWSDGTKIRVFVFPDDDPLHQSLAKEKLKVFSYQLRSNWDRLVYSGTGQAPIKVNSSEEMLAKVASTPGAIGYLRKATINENINVLQIK